MVTPVISEKPVHATTDRTAQSNRNSSAAASQDQAAQTQPQNSTVDDPPPQVDAARQHFHLEASPHQASGPRVENSEQARALLDQMLPQITDAPDKFLQVQTAAASAVLTSLLEYAPG